MFHTVAENEWVTLDPAAVQLWLALLGGGSQHFLHNHRASEHNSTHKAMLAFIGELKSSITVSWCKPHSKSARSIEFILKKVITVLEKDKKNPKHVLLDARTCSSNPNPKLHQTDKPRLSSANYDNVLSVNITPSCIFRFIILSPTSLSPSSFQHSLVCLLYVLVHTTVKCVIRLGWLGQKQ